MVDFEIFDKASRGAWGSFLLLFRTKGRSLAALGALLTLLLLATDTFFQQVTEYPDRWALENMNSTIPRVVRYEPFYTPEFEAGLETTLFDPAMKPVVGQFMVDNGTQPITFANGTRPEIPLACPSSNCTWPLYDTLAICSKCIEISDLLHHGCVTTKVDWSITQSGPVNDSALPVKTACGYFLNITSQVPVLMSGYILENNVHGSWPGETLLVRNLPLADMITKEPIQGGSLKFKNIRNPILDALIVSAADGPETVYKNVTPIAHECMLAWCVQTIQSSYALGDYKEHVVATSLNTTSGSWPWVSSPVLEGDEVLGTNVLYQEDVAIAIPPHTPGLDIGSTTYGSLRTPVSNVMQIFDDYFPSSYTVESPTATPMLRYKNYLFGPSLRKLRSNPFLAPGDISHHMERLATAMTNVIRSDKESHEMVNGKAYNRKQFIEVRWEWLAFPITLLVLSFIFLVATIVTTSRSEHEDLGIWKTSAMPTLLYSLPQELQRDLQGQESRGFRVSGKARQVKLQLLPREGWRVSGHHLPSPTIFRRLNNQPPPGWI